MAFKKNEKIWFWNHGTEFHLEYVGKYDDIVSWICEPSARMNWNQWAICNWWKSTGSWKLLLVADILQSNYQQDWQNNMKYYDIASNYTWIGLLDFKNLYSYIYTYNHSYIFIIRWWFHNKKREVSPSRNGMATLGALARQDSPCTTLDHNLGGNGWDDISKVG